MGTFFYYVNVIDTKLFYSVNVWTEIRITLRWLEKSFEYTIWEVSERLSNKI